MKVENPEPQSEYVHRYTTEVAARVEAWREAREMAKAVLLVLAERDIEVPDEACADIIFCIDIAQLELWLRRAGTVKTLEELFA